MASEQVQFGYSSKNISIASPKEDLQQLIVKTKIFLKFAWWRTFFNHNPYAKSSQKVTYGFKSPKNPDPVRELRECEEKVLDIV